MTYEWQLNSPVKGHREEKTNTRVNWLEDTHLDIIKRLLIAFSWKDDKTLKYSKIKSR